MRRLPALSARATGVICRSLLLQSGRPCDLYPPGDFPDLIIIDGGLGQLNYSILSLNEIGVKIPIVSLAKKFEEVYTPNNMILTVVGDADFEDVLKFAEDNFDSDKKGEISLLPPCLS